MDNLFYMWLVVALLCVLFEMGHPGLFLFLSFSFGALVSAFSTFFTESWIVQCLVFLGFSITSFFVLLTWVKNTLVVDHAHHKTNTQALVGKHAVVVRAISFESPGEVKIGGELWMARVTKDLHIKEGEKVTVVMVRGAHVVVEPAE